MNDQPRPKISFSYAQRTELFHQMYDRIAMAQSMNRREGRYDSTIGNDMYVVYTNKERILSEHTEAEIGPEDRCIYFEVMPEEYRESEGDYYRCLMIRPRKK